MTVGTVTFCKTAKGFGCIQPDDGVAEVFVHLPAVERAGLRSSVEGQKLSFDILGNNRSGNAAAESLQAAWTRAFEA